MTRIVRQLPTREQHTSSINTAPSAGDEQQPAKSSATAIYASLLIPGRGPPIKDQLVILDDGVIAYIGDEDNRPGKYSSLTPTRVPVLMPGMWDCHTHFMGASSLDFAEMLAESPATLGARLARSAQDTLFAGFTSCRDMGSYALELAKAIEDGGIVGPHLYGAGAAISQTAGHGDQFELPIGWVWGLSGVQSPNANGGFVGVTPLCIADGVEECRKAIRLQIRRGARVIKVLASGGVLSRDDDPRFQQFSDEELEVMVREAGRFKRVLGGHVHGKDGILAALRAGFHTLEHGTGLDEECCKIMKDQGAILVATRTIVAQGMQNLDKLGPEQREKMKWTDERHKKAYALAVKSGVKCALGTDMGVSKPGAPFSHGRNGEELEHAVEAGMTPLGAIEAATAMGPETLGPQAPKSGQIKVGYDADVIALKKNPLDDIKIVQDVKNITYVWKSGKLSKAPGVTGLAV
ncbi:MAG: hypothetical protein Q9227_003530 [Pyrenula ochraceoflavens]